jgi:hypothetical protein
MFLPLLTLDSAFEYLYQKDFQIMTTFRPDIATSKEQTKRKGKNAFQETLALLASV